MVEYSVIIKNAQVVDGSGKAPYKANIGIMGSKVAEIGKVNGDAITEIDAAGKVAVPGFIDSHSHGDFSVLFYPKSESYVYQGVTTMVTGNCGMSPAPLGDMIGLPGEAAEWQYELEPYKYYPKHTKFPREQVNKIMQEKYGWIVDWHSMDDWFKKVEKKQISINVATHVGHVTVRNTVMGDDFERPATKEERTEMGDLIRKSLDEGCIGLSVGLDYDPDTFADREELVEHVKIAAEYGAVFVPHSRRTGRRRNVVAGQRPQSKIDAINEVIEIARAAKVRMVIAHLFTGWNITPEGPPMLEEANRLATLKVIDDANDSGMDISFDCLPSCMTDLYNGAQWLCGTFEPWVREKGTRAEFAKWLQLEEYRDEIKDAIKSGKWYTRESPNTNPTWASSLKIFKHANESYVGRFLSEIAEDKKKEPFDVWFDLITEDPDALGGHPFTYPSGPPILDATYHHIFWKHPAAALGIDTGGHDCKHVPHTPIYMLPMIMFTSAFPGFLERYVVKEKVFSLEEAVYKTSTQAAERYGLPGRGTITPGSYADIVLLDMKKLKVNATVLEPRKRASGIDEVLVNGVTVLKGEHTGKTPGMVIRRKYEDKK